MTVNNETNFSRSQLELKVGGNDLSLSLYRSGPRGGVPLLFIHGLAGNHQTFNRAPEQLDMSGYHLLVPELPGHGKSASSESYPYTPGWYTDVMIALLKSCDIKPGVVIGHSMGGTIGLLLCETLDVPARFLCLEGIPRRLKFLERRLERHGNEESLEVGYDKMRMELGSVEEPGVKAWVEWSKKTSPRAFFQSAAKFVHLWQQHDMMERYKQLPRDHRHYIVGGNSEVEFVKKRLGKEEYSIIPEAGHFMMIDRPDSFWETVRTRLKTWNIG